MAAQQLFNDRRHCSSLGRSEFKLEFTSRNQSSLRTVKRARRWAGLQILGPVARPKTPPRPDAKIKSAGVNDVWCIDVVFGSAQRGATVKFLTLRDSHFNLDMVA